MFEAEYTREVYRESSHRLFPRKTRAIVMFWCFVGLMMAALM